MTQSISHCLFKNVPQNLLKKNTLSKSNKNNFKKHRQKYSGEWKPNATSPVPEVLKCSNPANSTSPDLRWCFLLQPVTNSLWIYFLKMLSQTKFTARFVTSLLQTNSVSHPPRAWGSFFLRSCWLGWIYRTKQNGPDLLSICTKFILLFKTQYELLAAKLDYNDSACCQLSWQWLFKVYALKQNTLPYAYATMVITFSSIR